MFFISPIITCHISAKAVSLKEQLGCVNFNIPGQKLSPESFEYEIGKPEPSEDVDQNLHETPVPSLN